MSKRLSTRPPAKSERGETTKQLSGHERQEAKRRESPRAAVVFEAVRREGQQELERPNAALAFSGLAAGLSMGFSLVATGTLHAALPNAAWRPLVENLGYTLGFLIAVIGRQQLFTENTVTAIIPLLDSKEKVRTFGNVIRLWSIVFSANLLGTFLFALLVAKTGAFSPDIKRAFLDIATTTLSYGFSATAIKGIFAGWLIALMVWLLPGAAQSRLWVVMIVTYIVGAAGLSHVVAGSVEAFYALIVGATTWNGILVNFLFPVFFGNCIGGVLLVSILNYAQVAPETAKVEDAEG